jgi:hypothetical protein
MVGHWVALPRPANDDALLAHGLAALSKDDPPGWRLTHILYADCRCSQSIFEHLLHRPMPEGVAERVVLVGEDDGWEGRARARGIELVHMTREELKARLGIESAPLLVISEPSSQVRYVGGYTDRKQGLGYRDAAVLAALRSGTDVPSMPVFGCGVSQQLQATLDPIGIRYRR